MAEIAPEGQAMFEDLLDENAPWRSPKAAWDWFKTQAFDIPPEENAIIYFARLTFFLALALLSLGVLAHPIGENAPGGFMHLIHLPFHEAGHFLFQFFGRFIHVLGGTLGQLLVPLLITGAFLAKQNPFGATVGTWWLAHSFMDCAPYINDARAGRLELLGGVTGSEMPDYHDWEVMLKQLGMLKYDHTLAMLFWAFGALLMLSALGWGAYTLWKQKPVR